MSTVWSMIAISAAGGAVLGIIMISHAVIVRRSDRGSDLDAILQRLELDGHCRVGWDAPIWRRPSDASRLGEADASYLLQAHYECDANTCPWKMAGFHSLVAARKARPNNIPDLYID